MDAKHIKTHPVPFVVRSISGMFQFPPFFGCRAIGKENQVFLRIFFAVFDRGNGKVDEAGF